MKCFNGENPMITP